MTKEELEASCRKPSSRKAKIITWTSEIYGRGKIYREYGFYPKKWPLNVYSSHGVTLRDDPAKHELETDLPVMFYFSKRLTECYKQLSKRRVFTIIEPFVYYRRKNKIIKSVDAKGTLVFVGHSTPRIDDESDTLGYMNQLLELPEQLKPLVVCLHFHDINKGLHLDYLRAGFEVVTMGNSLNDNYVEEFYDMLRHFKYCCSNLIGSYAHYAVEMGIPFYYYGNPPEFNNKGDLNVELGSFKSVHYFKKALKAKELFSILCNEVTVEQTNFVEEQLGVHDSISRFKCSCILYWSYFQYLMTLIISRKGLNVIKKIIIRILKKKHD